MTNDWRDFRPAIWLGMIGIAVLLLIQPAYIGGAILGAAIGIALKIDRGRRRVARTTPARRPRRR